MKTIPDWNKLKIFYLTAKAQSFSAAAESMHISQSSISRQIASFEEDIGSSLFNRHNKGLTLTEQGELLFKSAQYIYKKISETEDVLISGKVSPKGALKVTTSASFGSLWLSPAMPEFIRQYPDINLEFHLDDHPMDLARREADIAIRMWRPTEPDLIVKPFISIKCHYYASGAYLAEMGVPKKEEDLDHHRLIAYSAKISDMQEKLNQHLYQGRYPVQKKTGRKPYYSSNNLRSVLHAAQSGIGIASLPDYMTHKVKHLRRVLKNVQNHSADTYIVYPYELRNTKRIAVFIAFLEQTAKKWGFTTNP